MGNGWVQVVVRSLAHSTLESSQTVQSAICRLQVPPHPHLTPPVPQLHALLNPLMSEFTLGPPITPKLSSYPLAKRTRPKSPICDLLSVICGV